MKFLLDMGITPRAVPLLEGLGHEAHRCSEFGLSKALDEELVMFARENGHVLITTDKRFGDIVMLSASLSPAVIILRLGNATFDRMLSGIERVLETYTESEILSAVIVVEPDKVRRRPLE